MIVMVGDRSRIHGGYICAAAGLAAGIVVAGVGFMLLNKVRRD